MAEHDWTPLLVPLAREGSRRALMHWLMSVLLLAVVGAFITMWWKSDQTEAIAIVLTPVIGIASAATGFYFGGKDDEPAAP